MRTLFRILRIIGDAKAAQRGAGPLAKRMLRRKAHRKLSRALRKL